MQKAILQLAGCALSGASMVTTAALLDGSAPLLCAVTSTVSCDTQRNCIEGPADAVNLPVFLKIDVANNVAEGIKAGGEKRTSKILTAEQADDSLVLLGADQGMGWSASIDQTAGKMTLSVSGAAVGYLAFGTCLPQ